MDAIKAMSTDQLRAELKRLQSVVDDNYWMFTRCASSKCAGYLKTMSEAEAQIRKIKLEVRKRGNPPKGGSS